MRKFLTILFLLPIVCFGQPVLTTVNHQTVTNKTMDYNNNTFLNFPISSIQSYFFYNIASDISTYLQMLPNPSTNSLQNITNSGVTNGQTLAVFSTNSGYPNKTFLPPGVINFYCHAHQTSGTKDSQLYFLFYQRNTGGTETLLATSGNTSLITGIDAEYSVDANLPATTLVATDRLVVKVIALVSGVGSAPTIELDIEGNTLSRVQFPVSSVTNSVTSVATGYGLTGGTITSTGTLLSDTTAHATSSNTGYLSNVDWTIFNNKISTAVDTIYRTSGKDSIQFTIGGRYHAILDSASGGASLSTLTISSPLTGTSYNGSSPVTIGIQNAAADGSTKGAASFTANDFDASSGNISIDYANGQKVSSSHAGFAPTASGNNYDFLDGTGAFSQPISYELLVYKSLGSAILAQVVGTEVGSMGSSTTLTSQRLQFAAVWLPKAATITGIKWFQGTQGNYTASNYNGVALFSYSGGTLTLIDTSNNDGNIWKGTANNFQAKALHATHSLSAGLYFVAFVYSNSAQTAAPTIGSMGTLGAVGLNNMDFTNSGFIYGQKASVTSISGSYAASGISTSQFVPLMYIY